VLQAFVTEGLKPVVDHVISYGMGHFYISQSDKGGLVFGGDLDGYASYARRGNLPRVEHVMEAGMTLMPMLGRARLLRSWGGNAGWCYGGFKAVPGSGVAFAKLIATGEPLKAAAAYRLDRFLTGHLIDEEGTGALHNRH